MSTGASPRPFPAATRAAGTPRRRLLAALLLTGSALPGVAAAQVRGTGGAPSPVPPGAFVPVLGGVSSVGAAAVQVLPAASGRLGLRISNNAPTGGTTLWCSDVLGAAAWAAGASGTFPILAGTFYEGGADANAVVCGTAAGTVAITVEGW